MQLHGADEVAGAAVAEVQEAVRPRVRARGGGQQHSGLPGEKQIACSVAARAVCLLHDPLPRRKALHLHAHAALRRADAAIAEQHEHTRKQRGAPADGRQSECGVAAMRVLEERRTGRSSAAVSAEMRRCTCFSVARSWCTWPVNQRCSSASTAVSRACGSLHSRPRSRSAATSSASSAGFCQSGSSSQIISASAGSVSRRHLTRVAATSQTRRGEMSHASQHRLAQIRRDTRGRARRVRARMRARLSLRLAHGARG
jgi:hypothetical protein